jgi:transcriptional regulator with XRE-family HTH domain
VSGAHEARETLGRRLRDLRVDAELNGRQLATLAGWQSSKVSKIEYGKQMPTDADIRAWCRHCGAHNQVADLIATLRNVEAAYLEYKRIMAAGLRHPQQTRSKLENETRYTRWYEPCLVPGFLQTSDYLISVLRKVTAFYEIPTDDFDAAVTKRLDRQRNLHQGNRRYHFILAEQVLFTTVGDDDVMIAQLDRLLRAMSLPRVVISIIPANASYEVPTTNFVLYDRHRVQVETIAAELTITQPREVALYEKTFLTLAKQAVIGDAARALITAALDRRQPS